MAIIALTYSLILYPTHGADHQTTEEGGNPDELESELGQQASEGSVAHDNSIMVGVRRKLQRPPSAAGG